MAKPETAAAGRKPAEKQGEEAPLVERDVRGALTVLTMQYRPYNLVGPKLMRVLLAELAAAPEAGSRAIVLRSGLRHFSAGADLDLFEIGRESCRERVWQHVEISVDAVLLKKKKKYNQSANK